MIYIIWTAGLNPWSNCWLNMTNNCTSNKVKRTVPWEELEWRRRFALWSKTSIEKFYCNPTVRFAYELRRLLLRSQATVIDLLLLRSQAAVVNGWWDEVGKQRGDDPIGEQTPAGKCDCGEQLLCWKSCMCSRAQRGKHKPCSADTWCNSLFLVLNHHLFVVSSFKQFFFLVYLWPEPSLVPTGRQS